jgi:hypothetical protein
MLAIKGCWGAAPISPLLSDVTMALTYGRLRCGVVHTASYTQPLVVLLYYVRSCSLVLGIVQRRVVKTADLFTVLLAQL